MFNYNSNGRDNGDKYGHGSTDDTTIDIHGYGSGCCPRCGSTDIISSSNYCNRCGNKW
ncbi:MAG: hypothetical protein RSB87_06735 [Clostridia bacterium]